MASSLERDEIYNKRSFLDRPVGKKFNLGDMLDMLWVDANKREFIDEFDEVEMEKRLLAMQEGEVITIFSSSRTGGQPFLRFRRDGDFYTLIASFALAKPINDRAICSDAGFSGETMGRGFASGGGNSYPSGLRFS